MNGAMDFLLLALFGCFDAIMFALAVPLIRDLWRGR